MATKGGKTSTTSAGLINPEGAEMSRTTSEEGKTSTTSTGLTPEGGTSAKTETGLK